jgi:hypothetical protein
MSTEEGIGVVELEVNAVYRVCEQRRAALRFPSPWAHALRAMPEFPLRLIADYASRVREALRRVRHRSFLCM